MVINESDSDPECVYLGLRGCYKMKRPAISLWVKCKQASLDNRLEERCRV